MKRTEKNSKLRLNLTNENDFNSFLTFKSFRSRATEKLDGEIEIEEEEEKVDDKPVSELYKKVQNSGTGTTVT